jgi:hypothetical protein
MPKKRPNNPNITLDVVNTIPQMAGLLLALPHCILWYFHLAPHNSKYPKHKVTAASTSSIFGISNGTWSVFVVGTPKFIGCLPQWTYFWETICRKQIMLICLLLTYSLNIKHLLLIFYTVHLTSFKHIRDRRLPSSPGFSGASVRSRRLPLARDDKWDGSPQTNCGRNDG